MNSAAREIASQLLVSLETRWCAEEIFAEAGVGGRLKIIYATRWQGRKDPGCLAVHGSVAPNQESDGADAKPPAPPIASTLSLFSIASWPAAALHLFRS